MRFGPLGLAYKSLTAYILRWIIGTKAIRSNPVQTLTGAASPRTCVGLDGDLCTHRPAQRHDTVVDDAVIDLYTVAPLAQYTRFVQGIEVL